MKLLVFIICAIAGTVGYGQAPSETISKGTKKVIITAEDSGEVLYKRFGKYLTVNGYEVAKSTIEFLNLRTEPRETTKFNFSYVVNATVEGNQVIVTMEWRQDSANFTATDATSFYEWEYEYDKKNKDVREVIYQDLLNNLSALQKKSITYSR